MAANVHQTESATGTPSSGGHSVRTAPNFSEGKRITMKTFLGVLLVAACLLLPMPSAAQNQRSDDDQRLNQGSGASHDRWRGRLSTEDQGRFDTYYSRWLNYTQTNDPANRNGMEERMRDVMSHYDIPSDVPFDQIASNSNGNGAHRLRDEDRDERTQGDRAGRGQNHLTVEDQQRFDSYYSRWLTAKRTGDRSETGSMEERMRDLMGRNSIPLSVQFSQIASESAGRYSRPNIPRFSGRDASDFRSYYSRWQEYKRNNNRGEVASMEERMRKVMTDHNVPNNASYEDVVNMLNGNDR